MQSKATPLMQQYFALKEQYQDALLLFQVGDFYELFFDDAKTVAAFLGIALTKRGNINGDPIPLCGFPLHAVDHYIPKLIKGGFKVAICDQLEQATPGKMVKRGITNVLTPGTLSADNLLDEKSPSFLCTFYPHEKGWGLLFSELISSQMYATYLPDNADRQLEAELYRFLPDEVIVPAHKGIASFIQFFKQRGFFTSLVHEDEQQEQAWQTWLETLDDRVHMHLAQHTSVYQATKTWFLYVNKYQSAAVQACTNIQFYEPEDFLLLDTTTLKNLDIIKHSISGTRKYTLLNFIDCAVTPMGSRQIKLWLVRPLRQKDHIIARQEVIALLLEHPSLLMHVQQALLACGDIERVIGRIALDKAPVSDYIALKTMLNAIPQVTQLLQQYRSIAFIDACMQRISDFTGIQSLLEIALHDDMNHDWIIKKGFSSEVDQARDLVENGAAKILQLEAQEQKRTGINSLKIRYNSVQGYYIEITKTNLDLVPQEYIRLQTLAGKERFITKELQALQFQMMQAQQSIAHIEKQVFESIKQEIRKHIHAIKIAAQALARIDALVGFARVAAEYGYVRPEITHEKNIYIEQGRHPLLDAQLGNQCIANDTKLDDTQSLFVLTGPNMGGKSTYLRQVALISILAQCGSFVPAKRAQLPLLDRIFTRIGAGDNIAEGKSTFLLEMEEAAHICKQATAQSLVIVDEIGRGTSTSDGIAIAQAVLEYLHVQVQCKCVFATHYHELTKLCAQYPTIANYYAASKQTEQGIVFLHKIVPGIAQGSFGIQVAKLACLPDAIIERAYSILQQYLAKDSPKVEQQEMFRIKPAQHSMHEIKQEKHYEIWRKKIQALPLEEMSPKQALDILWDLQHSLEK